MLTHHARTIAYNLGLTGVASKKAQKNILGIYKAFRTLIDANFDNDKQLQRQDAFTRPFCYEPKSENHYTKWDIGQFKD